MRSINTGRWSITVRTGAEGPAHDPYHYTEYSVTPRAGGEQIILHLGLSNWLEAEGVTSHASSFSLVPSDIKGATAPKMSREQILVDMFESLTGLTPAAIEDGMQRARSRCPKCQCKRLEEQAGFPGETFTVCSRCGEIVDTEFNEGAVR